MKTNTAIKTALTNDHAIRAVPEVIIDWNMNRYYTATAENTPIEDDEGYDIEIFPIDSIVRTNRPRKGVNKARINQSTIGEDYQYSASGVRNGRYYIADQDDTYKYWTSPIPSSVNGVISKVKPQVTYNYAVRANKIVIKTENSWASAKTFSIQVCTVPNPTDAQWTSVANNTTLGDSWKATGEMVIYYQGNGTALTPWTTGARQDNADGTPVKVQIYGVRLVVSELENGYKITKDGSLSPSSFSTPNAQGLYVTQPTTGKQAFFDLIEISAHLEADLSKNVISYNLNADNADVSQLYPIGTVTSNQASINLSNIYKETNGEMTVGLFSRYNTASPYYNLIDANAEVICRLKYYDEDGPLLGTVQEFKMYVDNWGNQTTEEVQMELTDFSKFFDTNEAMLRPAMWENLTVPEIVWRIMDSIGFVDYNIDVNEDFVTAHRIPVFYTNGEETVWEVLAELSKASQTAIYFDSFGVLQVKTRDFAFSPADAPVWDFSAVTNGTTLANIIDLTIDQEFEPNHYKVTYQNTKWSPSNNGQPTMQQVWEPETETVALRATPLTRTLEADGAYMWISADEVRFWPYEGIVNVQGELMRFKGKNYVYYNASNQRFSMNITSQDEFNARNNKTPANLRHKNHFSGALRVTERGVWNSDPKRHTVEAEGYSVHQYANGAYKGGVGGFHHYKDKSRVTLVTDFKKVDNYRLATRGGTNDQPFYNYGTRFRILKDAGRTTQCAGLVIHNQGGKEDGYYIEFMPSVYHTGPIRKVRDELWVYSRQDGKNTILDRSPVAFAENIDYEVDVSWRADASGNHILNVWVNGKQMTGVTITGAKRVPANGKFGMFVRGSTRVEYEYLYAIRREEESPLMEDFSFLDKVETGYMGGQWDREWVYQTKQVRRRVKKKWKKVNARFNRTFFDEFGPIVHELREFDVKFDPAPVQHSRLYMTNDWAALCTEYTSDPFGAKFILANTSRRNAVIHGEDTFSFSGTGDSIDQVLTVLGRALVSEEGEEVVAENIPQIRRRGKNESEISSRWIQSKKMAQDVADWMNDHFSYGNEQVSLEVFGNPLIEIGDVVTVSYPQKHISGHFFVMAINNEFSNGLTTTLTLRRRV